MSDPEVIDKIPVRLGGWLIVQRDDGDVRLFTGTPEEYACAVLGTPEARDRFARAWTEACRRADGEAPAAQAAGDG